MKTNRLYSRAGGGEKVEAGQPLGLVYNDNEFHEIGRNVGRDSFRIKVEGPFRISGYSISSSKKEREIPLVPLFYSPLMVNCYEFFVYPKRQSIKVVSTIPTLLLSDVTILQECLYAMINISNTGILNF